MFSQKSASELVSSSHRKVRAPNYLWPGAKYLLAPKLLQYIPQQGRKFVDVCAGRGNLSFYAMAAGLDYKEWIINDPITAPFFHALRDIGNSLIVPQRTEEEFNRLAELYKLGDQRAILLAPFFTFNGGGFECGGATTDGGRRTPTQLSGKRASRAQDHHREESENNGARLGGLLGGGTAWRRRFRLCGRAVHRGQCGPLQTRLHRSHRTDRILATRAFLLGLV
ncbi:MAG: hypothetical protein DMG72_06305 [Acidobacteria bacterium]|nr:MAG: hypothetical protein DMG72_06305 [Acidobacteriota bacterium]